MFQWPIFVIYPELKYSPEMSHLMLLGLAKLPDIWSQFVLWPSFVLHTVPSTPQLCSTLVNLNWPSFQPCPTLVHLAWPRFQMLDTSWSTCPVLTYTLPKVWPSFVPLWTGQASRHLCQFVHWPSFVVYPFPSMAQPWPTLGHLAWPSFQTSDASGPSWSTGSVLSYILSYVWSSLVPPCGPCLSTGPVLAYILSKVWSILV